MSTTSPPRINKPPKVSSLTIKGSRNDPSNSSISSIEIVFEDPVDSAYASRPTIIFPPGNSSYPIPATSPISFSGDRKTVIYTFSATTTIDFSRYHTVSLSFGTYDQRDNIPFTYLN